MVTIQNVLHQAYAELEHASQTPELDSNILLAHVLKKNRAYLIAHRDKTIIQKQRDAFVSLIKRRVQGEPIAYLTGTKEFYGLPFMVNKYVLIPRPETEELVDMVVAEIDRQIKHGKKALTIIDVGTGSGNIGISVAHCIIKNRKHKKVDITLHMTDISGKALHVAKKNAKKLLPASKHPHLKVHITHADLLTGFDTIFDVIVSNPPYIPEEDIEFLDKNIKDFEPHVALSGGKLGIKYIHTLIRQSRKRLASDGALFLEIHQDHPEQIKLFIEEQCPDMSVTFTKDAFGQWRFARIRIAEKQNA